MSFRELVEVWGICAGVMVDACTADPRRLSLVRGVLRRFTGTLPPMDIVLFGIQGSGKGTQAKKLAAELGYEIFEAGGALRAIAASGSELGATVQSYIDQGHLVPHEIIMQVVAEAVRARPAGTRIVFDGIPRDLDQMRDFDALMEELKREFTCVQFVVDEEAAVQRILKRAQTEGRADDAEEATIRRRMATFKQKTLPVIEQYRAAGKLREVAGDGNIDDVYARFKTAVTARL